MIRSSRHIWFFIAKLKLLDESCHIPVIWCGPGQPLGVFERSFDVAGITAESDKRQQGIAIIRMPLQALLENGHGFVAASRRMQRHGIDIGVSRAIGLKLNGAAQFAQRLVETLEARQRETERMV